MNTGSKTVILALFAIALSAHKIDVDDRQYLNKTNEKIFSGVGKVVCRDTVQPSKTISVTGTLIGNAETVITVGHYRTAPTGHIFTPAECKYLNFDENGNVRFSRKIRAERVARSQGDYVPYNTAIPDWALLRLEQPANTHLAQPLSYQILSFDRLIDMDHSVMIAHHSKNSGANPNRKIVSPSCRIEQRAKRTRYFVHYCDTSLGSSGGLFYAPSENKAIFAFALNTAESDPGKVPAVNFGQPLTGEHDALIRNLDW